MFSMDKLRSKSQLFAVALVVSLVLSSISLIMVIFAYIDIHVWSKQGEVVLVPQEQLVNINGNIYIPIKIIS